MRKLLILPGVVNTLGGTLVTLSLLLKGFKDNGAAEQVCVLVPAGSLIEKYLKDAGQDYCLQLIEAQTLAQFVRRSLQWVSKQPNHYPLLLDNCMNRLLMPDITLAAPALRLSNRPIYHFCHDFVLTENLIVYLARKFAFTWLAAGAICNSYFTAGQTKRFIDDIRGVLYQPVDTKRFNNSATPPPLDLQPILNSGARIMLTASRITQPEINNDKNLRALIAVLSHLKATGHFYHAVVVGEDKSPGQIHSRDLRETAQKAGVADQFTILPPTFAIADYYKHAHIVVTLAPREPFGRTVVEAIACGVPVVGSCTGGIGEILHNFAPQWTVDPNDPLAAAAAIMDIATNADTPKVLAKAQDWVETHCSIEVYTRRMMQLTQLMTASNSVPLTY